MRKTRKLEEQNPVRRTAALVAVMLSVAVALGALSGSAQAAKDIPWQPTALFNRVSVEEDIKDILRRIVVQNGQEAVFRPGVKGIVSFEFSNMPLQAAFNKLIAENGLDFDYDPKTKLVTIFAASRGERTKTFIPLAHASKGAVMSAIKKFGLGGEVSFDDKTNTVLLGGTSDQVETLTSLIERLDKAAGARVAAAEARAKVAVAEDAARTQSRLLDRILKQEVRVIRLRFATVASTKKTFLGEEVSVPGIEETIRVLVGDNKELRKNLPKDFQEELENIAPDALTGIFISTDPRTNTVIVRGSPEDLDNVEALVRRLDKSVPLIQIEVLIVRAQRGISDTFGVDWAFERNRGLQSKNLFLGVNSGISDPDPSGVAQGLGATDAQANIAGDTADANNVQTGQNAQSAAAAAINTALQTLVLGYVYQGTTFALQAQIEAFEQDNKAQTIAAPTLVTTNNVAARVERTASQFFDVTIGDSASLEEVDVGLAMTITPAVIPKIKEGEQELIRLVVNARNTAIAAGTFAASTASTSGQEVQTEVIIPSGRTFVMGGLADDTRTDSKEGIPLLKDIPVLGNLFGTTSSSDQFVETIFFITPKVIYPEQILPRDIASRRYLLERKFGLAESRRALQEGSNILADKLSYQEEDE